MAVISELSSSLNMQSGGELSRNLARLYDYASSQLAEANYRQQDAPLAEILSLFATLAEAFDQIRDESAREAPAQPAAVPHEGYPGPQLVGRYLQPAERLDAQGWTL
jgi:flagellar protein FliS